MVHKNSKVMGALLALAMMAQVSAPMNINADWNYDGKNWTYIHNGTKKTGWFKDEYNCWYFLDMKTGIMKTGWFAGDAYTWYWLNPANGIMQVGWQQINGKWYYLDNTGAMLNETVHMGYELKKGGIGVPISESGSYSLGKLENELEYYNIQNNLYTKEFNGKHVDLKAIRTGGKLIIEGGVDFVNLVDCDIDEIIIKNKTGNLELNISKDSNVNIVTLPKEATFSLDDKLKYETDVYQTPQYKVKDNDKLHVDINYSSTTNKDKDADKRRRTEIKESVHQDLTPNQKPGDVGFDFKKAYAHDKDNSNKIAKGIISINSASDFTTRYNSSGVAITGFRGKGNTVVIPAEIDGYPVTEISNYAFEDCGLETVVLPSSIYMIGDSAFADNAITKMYFPSELILIGEDAFRNNKITEVQLGESVEDIGDYAFAGNKPLTKFSYKDGIDEIGNYAFADCSLKSLKISDDTRIIGDGAFQNNLLSSITLGGGLVEIGDYAFENNNLSKVDIPSAVESVGERAFADNDLKSATVGENVYSIGSEAFYISTSSPRSNDELETVSNLSRNEFDWRDIFFGRSGKESETGTFQYSGGTVVVKDYKGKQEGDEEENKEDENINNIYTVTVTYGKHNTTKTFKVRHGESIEDELSKIDTSYPGKTFTGWSGTIKGITKDGKVEARYKDNPYAKKATVYLMSKPYEEAQENDIYKEIEVYVGEYISDIKVEEDSKTPTIVGHSTRWKAADGTTVVGEKGATLFPVYVPNNYKGKVVITNKRVEELTFTYGKPMTALNNIVLTGAEKEKFDGFYLGGTEVTANTEYRWAKDVQFVVKYRK